MHRAPTHLVAGLPQPGRCLVMGIINVTPDSFSDGGRWLRPEAAIAHGLALLEQGADVVDIGGESTRPGAVRPDLDVELSRVLPVITELSRAGAAVTVDTMRAEVARAAVAAGAAGINDVSGGRADEAMLPTAAELAVPFICMHWRGHSTTMQDLAVYDDVVVDVGLELSARVDAALAAGVSPDHLVLDPGLGFAKTADHNWALLAALDTLADLGYPLMLGASRKAFLGSLLADAAGDPRPPARRDDATAAISAIAALSGVWCVRVHDVKSSRDAVAVGSRWVAEELVRDE
ncbi:MAG: dihydropteroate synthase [Nocardioidaceae bacterium]|nr:dihydropteroate synthase [Nocardioidaceae bacterium]